MERYNFKETESKWQKIWEKQKTFSTKIDKDKKKLNKKKKSAEIVNFINNSFHRRICMPASWKQS